MKMVRWLQAGSLARQILAATLAVFGMVGGTGSVEAAQLGLIDDFTVSDGGWLGSPPIRVPDGGPNGAGDGYLRIDSTGGFGPGSKLATYNESAAWVGDYLTLGATSVELDVVNFPTSESALNLRLTLFGPTNTSNRWTSTEAVVVPNDGQWRHVSFPLDVTALARVQGRATYEQMMANVVRVMFRHDASTPSAQGTSIVGSAGIDNLTLVGPNLLVGDFNADGVVDVVDVNLLLTEVNVATGNLDFDLTGDSQVNIDDITELVAVEMNTYIGDANLDGEFNTGDLVAIFQAGQYEDDVVGTSTWETGDWNGDAEFGTGDLLFAFQQGGFEQGPRAALAAAIPEPTASSLLALGGLLLIGRRPRR